MKSSVGRQSPPVQPAPRRWPVATHVLVVHGTEAERDAVASSVYHGTPVPRGGYVRFDCRTEQHQLRVALCEWVMRDGCGRDAPALMGDRNLTLHLEAIDALVPECQRLLVELLDRLAETAVTEQLRPMARLVATSAEDLGGLVAAGRFSAELYDAVDKARVDLSAPASIGLHSLP
jgi:hypothetical protein